KRGRARKLTKRLTERATGEERGPLDPLAWLLADERRRLVRRALARVPARDAEILLLKYTEDWSYHQLADHIGISHSAVEARLHRARRRMREELAAVNLIEMSA